MKNMIVARVLCLVIAFLMWIYVMSVDSPNHEEVFDSVSLNLANTSSLTELGLSPIKASGTMADVTIKGKKSIINKYDVDDIRTYVDLTGITDSGTYTLEVKVDVPDGLMFVDVSPSSIEVYIDRNRTVEVDVQPVIKNSITYKDYETGTSEIKKITVEGPGQILDRIARGVLECDLGQVDPAMGALVATGPIKLVDVNGKPIDDPYNSIKMTDADGKSIDTMSFEIPVYKKVPVTFDFLDEEYMSKYIKEISVSPEFLPLVGDYEVLRDVKSVSINADSMIDKTLGESFLLGQYEGKVEIALGEGLTKLSGEKTDIIDVKIQHKNTKVISLSVSEFKENNPDGLKYNLITDALDIKLRVPEASGNLIKPESITATLDLSGADNSTTSVPVTISVDYEGEGRVYVIGTYFADIEILPAEKK